MRSKRSFAVIGAGRAGVGLALALARCGYRLTSLVAHSGRSATRLRSWLPAALRDAVTTDLVRALDRAETILICVPDRQIHEVARSLASRTPGGRRSLSGLAVLHASGAQPASILAPLRRRGAAIGCLHPLFSFPPPGSRPLDLSGVCFGIEGDRAAARAARAMASSVGGVPFGLPRSRTAYHLAASLLANGSVALMEAGLLIAARGMRVSASRARELFLPLVSSAIKNVSVLGPGRALTGPVARGDLRTVAGHLEQLAKGDPAIKGLYGHLALIAARMSHAGGRLDSSGIASMRRLLASTGIPLTASGRSLRMRRGSKHNAARRDT